VGHPQFTYACLLGISTKQVSRTRVAEPAFSECDRLLARPGEFANTEQGESSRSCDRDWRGPKITAHDGLVTENHSASINAMQWRVIAMALSLLSTAQMVPAGPTALASSDVTKPGP
jgi:hypothetical protein